jgi:hypothetical protein
MEAAKWKLYKSDTIINNHDRVKKACSSIRNNLSKYLGDNNSTTWKFYNYNFWTHCMLVDPILFHELWRDLISVIKDNSPADAEYAWVQSWLNYDTYDSVESNLKSHSHDSPLHGYISIAPQNTKTVFDEWEIINTVGDIYIGMGKWNHHVENIGIYHEDRVSIGYDVIYGDDPEGGWDNWVYGDEPEGGWGIDNPQRYQSLPWHEHWIPVIL